MEKNTSVRDSIQEAATPLAQSIGVVLWGVDLASGPGRQLVRIFIDSEDGKGAVDVEQCASLSRALGVALEVEEVLHGPYTLEVSSPGLERQFFELDQLRPYVGQEVDARLHEPLDGRKNFRGTLTGVGERELVLESEGKSFTLEWDAVKKAHLVYRFPGEGERS